MNQAIDVAQLRQVFLESSLVNSTRGLSMVLSLVMAVSVLWLLRRGKLREEYTPIWLAVSAGILLVTFRVDFLLWLTKAIGAWTPSSTVFFFGLMFLMAISLNYAIRLSTASLQLKNLAQRVALLQAQIDTLAQAPLDDHAGGDEPGSSA